MFRTKNSNTRLPSWIGRLSGNGSRPYKELIGFSDIQPARRKIGRVFCFAAFAAFAKGNSGK